MQYHCLNLFFAGLEVTKLPLVLHSPSKYDNSYFCCHYQVRYCPSWNKSTIHDGRSALLIFLHYYQYSVGYLIWFFLFLNTPKLRTFPCKSTCLIFSRTALVKGFLRHSQHPHVCFWEVHRASRRVLLPPRRWRWWHYSYLQRHAPFTNADWDSYYFSPNFLQWHYCSSQESCQPEPHWSGTKN